MESEHQHDFDWNDIYTGEASDLEEVDPFFLAVLDELEPGRALDIGCGAGGLVVALAERGWQVTGVDIAPKAIAAARKALEARGLSAELHVGDASEWTSSATYDLVTNSFALPNEQEGQAAVFRLARDVLAPGGTVLIKDFDSSMKRHKVFSRFHCPTIDELVAAFDGLAIVRAEVVETPVHHHDGAEPGLDGPWTAAVLHARKNAS